MVDPRDEVWIGGAVGTTVGSGADDAPMHALDHRERLVGLLGGAEGRDGDELAGAHEPVHRTSAVLGVIGHAGHGERMHGLQEQGSDAADEHRPVGVDAPGDAVGTEQTGVALDRGGEIAHRRVVAGEQFAQAPAESEAHLADDATETFGGGDDERGEVVSGHGTRLRGSVPDPPVGARIAGPVRVRGGRYDGRTTQPIATGEAGSSPALTRSRVWSPLHEPECL